MPELTKVKVRERILSAAVGLLEMHGVKKLAQPQVAKAAGVPQGHLTYYFPRKSDLLIAVAKRAMDRVLQDVSAVFSQTRTGSVADAVTDLISFVVKDRARSRILVGLLLEAENDPALHEVLIDYSNKFNGFVAQLLGREPGHPEAFVAQAALWGLGLQHLLYAGERSDQDTDQRIRVLMEFIKTNSVDSNRKRATE